MVQTAAGSGHRPSVLIRNPSLAIYHRCCQYISQKCTVFTAKTIFFYQYYGFGQFFICRIRRNNQGRALRNQARVKRLRSAAGGFSPAPLAGFWLPPGAHSRRDRAKSPCARAAPRFTFIGSNDILYARILQKKKSAALDFWKSPRIKQSTKTVSAGGASIVEGRLFLWAAPGKGRTKNR
jgi:hypothetical protein